MITPLEMILSTSVQNFSRIQCFILQWQHVRLRVLLTDRLLKISDDVTVTSFLNQSQTILNLFVIPRGISVQNLSKIRQETKLQKMGNDAIVTSFLKIAQQFFVCEYFLLIPIDVPSFKLIEGQIKE